MNLKQLVVDADERLKKELGKLLGKLHDPDVSEEEKDKIRSTIKKLEHDLRQETGAIRAKK